MGSPDLLSVGARAWSRQRDSCGAGGLLLEVEGYPLTPLLATAQSGRSFADARADREAWGHLVESAVGAHLANTAAATGELELSWWREGGREVDFVLSGAGGLAAIEVKSGRAGASQPGIAAFTAAFTGLGPIRPLLVGGDGIPLERFLLEAAERWVQR